MEDVFGPVLPRQVVAPTTRGELSHYPAGANIGYWGEIYNTAQATRQAVADSDFNPIATGRHNILYRSGLPLSLRLLRNEDKCVILDYRLDAAK